jgi:TolB-like protein/Tfp pilus assembly protein PilF
MRFADGSLFAGYTIVSRLGRGGAASVYLVREPGLERLVALKVLPEHCVDDAMFASRFEQEARVIAGLDHPNIIPLYRYGIEDDVPWMALRYVDGGDFAARLVAGPLPTSEGITILRSVASALDYAHSRGVIHRDLKPQNILLASQGAAYLADFGIAKLLEGSAGLRTATGSIFGTPAYMAPEQAIHSPIGPYTDVYALAAICFRWLTGRLPFDADTPHAILLQHVQEPLSRDALDSLPPGADAVIERGMAKDPQQRYQSAGELVAQLEDALQTFSPTQLITPAGTTSRPQSKRAASVRSSDVTLPTAAPTRSAAVRNPLILSLALLAAAVCGLALWWAVRSPLTPATGSLLLGTNADCRLTVDNAARGMLRAGASQRLELAPGEHLVQCASTELGSVVVAQSKGVTAGQQTVAVIDMRASLAGARELALGKEKAPDQSIAVLPFIDLSQAKDQEYFSDGIAEELLNLLSRIPELQVSARTSSFSFKGKTIEAPEIARQLHVAHILEGSVRNAGNKVRVTTQLIRAADGFQIWSQTYERKLDDIFAIQDEIAADVVKQLKLTLLSAVPKVRTTDSGAYALYLQARQLGLSHTPEAFAKADAMLREVLAIDPRYAPAWQALAHNFANETSIGVLPSKDGFARSREAVEKALAIDPDYAAARAQLGFIAMYSDNDLNLAAQQLQRAMALDPTDINVQRVAAILLGNLGRVDEELAIASAIVQRDPVNLSALNNLAITQVVAGRLDAALETYHALLRMSPGWNLAHFGSGRALLLKGDAADALAEFEQETSEMWSMFGAPMAYHALGRKADSDAALAALITRYEKAAPYNIAYVCAFLGESDKAFAWLDKAVEYGDSGLGEIVQEGLFDRIRSDPRWLPFMRKIGRAPEQLAKIEFKVTLPKNWPAEASAAAAKPAEAAN